MIEASKVKLFKQFVREQMKKMPKLEFIIVPPRKHRNEMGKITFYLNGGTISLELSVKEWKSLIQFLKMTKTKKNLPKDALGYEGITFRQLLWQMKTPRIFYFNLKQNLSFVDEWAKRWNYTEKKKKEEYRKVENEAEYSKKNLISPTVTLRKDDCSVYLHRKKFLRFRDECLDAYKEAGAKRR